MLNRHSQIAVTPETHFAIEMVHRFSSDWLELCDRPGATPEPFIRYLLYHTRLSDLRLDPAAVTTRLGEQALTPSNVFRCIMEEYAAVRTKPRVAEKTPGHVLHLEELFGWYPNAKFIWVVRDGRDVVRSVRQLPWMSDPWWKICFRWRRNVSEALRFQRTHPGIMHAVRYEALLRDPEREVRRLHDFLAIPFEPQQLRETPTSDVIPEWEIPWKSKANQPIDTSRAGAWHREASDRELCHLNCIMGRYLKKLGYPNTSVMRFGPQAVLLSVLVDLGFGLMLGKHVYRFARPLYRLLTHGSLRASLS